MGEAIGEIGRGASEMQGVQGEVMSGMMRSGVMGRQALDGVQETREGKGCVLADDLSMTRVREASQHEAKKIPRKMAAPTRGRDPRGMWRHEMNMTWENVCRRGRDQHGRRGHMEMSPRGWERAIVR